MKLTDAKRKELYSLANIELRFLDFNAPNRLKQGITPKFITIHETDNASKGAGSDAHARYMAGEDAQKRKVSWHFTCDSTKTIKHLPTSIAAWHAGTSLGNSSSVAIEMCVNSDGDYHATLRRAATLTAILMDALDLDIKSVVPHKRWSGKQCPSRLLSGKYGMTWDGFIEMVKDCFETAPAPQLALEMGDAQNETQTA